MAKHELWQGEAEQRDRIMGRMEEDRVARYRYAMASRDGGAEADADYRDRLAEQRQPSHAGRGPRGYQRSDERIGEEVHHRLTEAPDLDATEIQIQVHAGEVTLTGTVDGRAARRRAEDLAEAVRGVSYVMNNIRVRQPGGSGATG
jgi:osmotically-inducible protein OsmY